MRKIGGFFELELREGSEYHENALRLNIGRNAFEYILRAKDYKKVYLPYFTCDSMLQPIKHLKLDHQFYRINEKFEPIFDFSRIAKDEAFVYTNYFGIMDSIVESISKRCRNLIVDNAQAFYSKPLNGIDTFYSPRKFFGVPDGAYLYSEQRLDISLEKDKSFQRCEHLLRRLDEGPEAGFISFKMNDHGLSNCSIMKMSELTHCLLKSIDYNEIAKKRITNYKALHDSLGKYNKLQCEIREWMVPMVYPFLGSMNGLREHLINNGIFVARYWPNVLEWSDKDSMEYNYALNIVPLPIDQRYGTPEMDFIIKEVGGYLGN